MSLIAQRINPKAEGERWIGIAPFAAHQGKVYPPEKMERVVQLLLERDTRNRIFLFGGGKEERDMLDEWEKRHDRCTCASTLLSGLFQELVLMSHLDTMVSMDSANMHLASLTGTRLEPEGRRCRADRPALPPVQHLRQQALHARRLCVP